MADERRDRARKRPSTSINVPMAKPEAFPTLDRSSIVVPAAAPTNAFEAGTTPVSLKGRGPKGYQRTDEHIRHVVEEALAADPTLDATDIEVTVIDGEVRLIGMVAGPRARYAAVANAETVAGPGRVHSALKITGEP
jgi:osmotically-inducible protein OsmY